MANGNPRIVWCATLAKFVAPMEHERAAKAMMPLVAALHLPDAAFTIESAMHVAEEGCQIDADTRVPLKRVPTFGELQQCLVRWWGRKMEMQRLRASVSSDPEASARLAELRAEPMAFTRLPAPETPPERDEHAHEHVRGIVEQFQRERSWNKPTAGLDERATVKPRLLSDAALIVEYEKAANGPDPDFAALAATRLKALLAKPGARQPGERQ